jgi:hypothetical protein
MISSEKTIRTMSDLTLAPGRVYRSRDFLKQTSNPSRFAGKMVREGKLERLQEGLYLVPRKSRWGKLPVSRDELLRKWLAGRKGVHWIVTGSSVWNSLGLGSTGVRARPLIYNKKRSGCFDLGGHKLELRRVPFPPQPPAEWFVVDYLNNLRRTDGSLKAAVRGLRSGIQSRRFDLKKTVALAKRFGTKATCALVAEAIDAIPE